MSQYEIYTAIMRNYKTQLSHTVAALDKGDKDQARLHITICNGLTATLGY